jgi:hypothetical protein
MPHPRYKGKTRWEVLVENLNPNAGQVSKPLVYKMIGDKTKTSINRNQYVTVSHNKYSIPNPEVIEKLEANNYEVIAHYLPNSSGEITEVYLYQNDRFICKCEPIERYSQAKAEWIVGQDDQAFEKQSAFVSGFDKMIKQGKQGLIRPEIISNNSIIQAADAPLEIEEFKAHKPSSIDDLLAGYDPEAEVIKARNNI